MMTKEETVGAKRWGKRQWVRKTKGTLWPRSF